MDQLAIHLALHGVLVLTISIGAGLFLYGALLKKVKNEAAWHVVHAGGTVRGVMLIALAAIIHIPVLPHNLLVTAVCLIIFFVWTSMLAMILAAVSGDRGLGLSGSVSNKIVYLLYAVGTVAIFPGCFLLIYGLYKAL